MGLFESAFEKLVGEELEVTLCLVEAFLLALAAFTLGVVDFLELLELTPPRLSVFTVNGSVIILLLAAVGVVVQRHSPLAKAQLCPSLAVVYASV